MKTEFRKELEKLINRESIENGSNTPDFLLAEFLCDVLEAWDRTVTAREKWYGREPQKLMAHECPQKKPAQTSYTSKRHDEFALRIADLVQANPDFFKAETGGTLLESAYDTLLRLLPFQDLSGLTQRDIEKHYRDEPGARPA